MYERKIKEDLTCGITIAMKVFGAKWKPCILTLIANGYGRPSEIHRQLSEATPRVLDMQLTELFEMGIVSKSTGRGFPLFTVYHLTEVGESVLPIVNQLDAWGNEHKNIFQGSLNGVSL
jgi:DNA-binding HxlR family transcriptional regulator